MLPLQCFIDYIHQNALFEPNSRILLAVSGGKDSVLMVHLFKQAGFNFGIAHCNFGLRAEESVRDEHFVQQLAASMEVPLFVKHFDTKAFAGAQRISTQMAARDLRYTWFDELRISQQYDSVAVGHHQDDAIETVILNLVRGTGIAGLHGILPKRGHIIRPLLFLSRKDIDDLIVNNAIAFVEDSSNLSTQYARNKIRLEVIPRLKEINAQLEHTFARNMELFSATENVLQQRVSALRLELIEENAGVLYLSIDKLNAIHPKGLLLSELLKAYGFTAAVTEELLNSLGKQSGTSFYSHTHRITIDRTRLMITNLHGAVQLNQLIHPTDTLVQLIGQQITITYSNTLGFERNSFKAYVDLDKLIYPLVIRTWQEGDRFKPLGMDKYKKISDFFIDQKVPLPSKENIPILINGNGDIVWIVGLRQDNRYKLTSRTEKVAIFEQKIS